MASIVYEGADGRQRRELEDDDLHYREEHWQVSLGEGEFLYIPRDRVYRVRMHDPHLFEA
jgi:hypothetical protein